MPACSALLRICSPVFEKMFASGTKEAQDKRIPVTLGTEEDSWLSSAWL